ncbi:MAG: NADPH-dependent 7-cyano-7-deazaguanine reductase QueF [Legionellales bacterium]|nr:NADPH-dependent 7-cyano-7-deazaguanine reductase QueF [Legionellales bacterium]
MDAIYEHTLLGQRVSAPVAYDPAILQPLVRHVCRGDQLSKALAQGYEGWDDWMCHEVSWCDLQGCPKIAQVRIQVPALSRCLVESKSLKLYLNSLNFHRFESEAAFKACLIQDISQAVEASIEVEIRHWPDSISQVTNDPSDFECIDESLKTYASSSELRPDCLTLLDSASSIQRYVSYLFRSNCPVTGQPDWASIWIEIEGPKVDPVGLLEYLLSYRLHPGFHEQCIEQIWVDCQSYLQPHQLKIQGCFTPRGGIAIYPLRKMSKASNLQ